MKIELPYPNAKLNPNNKSHWAVKAKIQRQAKHIAYILTLEQLTIGLRTRYQIMDVIHLDVLFCPPDDRRRDLDNMIASGKYFFDGIALAMGVDDSKFRFTFNIGEKVKGGCVIINFDG